MKSFIAQDGNLTGKMIVLILKNYLTNEKLKGWHQKADLLFLRH